MNRCRALMYNGERCEEAAAEPVIYGRQAVEVCAWHAGQHARGLLTGCAPPDPTYPPPPPDGEYAGPAAGTTILPPLSPRYPQGPYRAGLQDALIGADTRSGDYEGTAKHAYVAAFVYGKRYLAGGGMEPRYAHNPPWPLPPEGQHWSARPINWPEPGEAFSHGTHSIHDEDGVVIALTWSAERAALLANLPELVRLAGAARWLVDSLPAGMKLPEETGNALAALVKRLNAAGY